MAFSLINHSLVWTWALALCEVHVVSESTSLSRLPVYLLLARQSLLELKLLLDFLLLVGEDGVLALGRLE